MGLGKFILLYSDTGFSVKRDIFEVKITKEYSAIRFSASSWEIKNDLAGDFLSETQSFDKFSTLAILSLAQSGINKRYRLEFFDADNYRLKKMEMLVFENWTSEPSESDKLLVKLLPYSQYLAVAKISEKKVILHYYGESGLEDRVINTDFLEIVDLKIGKNEKLMYIIDKNHGVLAEYQVQEIGCPPSAEVASCNQFFMYTDVKCHENASMFFDLKDSTCKCRPGYYKDQKTKTCQKCECPYLH